MYYKKVGGKWKRITNKLGGNIEKGRKKYMINSDTIEQFCFLCETVDQNKPIKDLRNIDRWYFEEEGGSGNIIDGNREKCYKKIDEVYKDDLEINDENFVQKCLKWGQNDQAIYHEICDRCAYNNQNFKDKVICQRKCTKMRRNCLNFHHNKIINDKENYKKMLNDSKFVDTQHIIDKYSKIHDEPINIANRWTGRYYNDYVGRGSGMGNIRMNNWVENDNRIINSDIQNNSIKYIIAENDKFYLKPCKKNTEIKVEIVPNKINFDFIKQKLILGNNDIVGKINEQIDNVKIYITSKINEQYSDVNIIKNLFRNLENNIKGILNSFNKNYNQIKKNNKKYENELIVFFHKILSHIYQEKYIETIVENNNTIVENNNTIKIEPKMSKKDKNMKKFKKLKKKKKRETKSDRNRKRNI